MRGPRSHARRQRGWLTRHHLLPRGARRSHGSGTAVARLRGCITSTHACTTRADANHVLHAGRFDAISPAAVSHVKKKLSSCSIFTSSPNREPFGYSLDYNITIYDVIMTSLCHYDINSDITLERVESFYSS
eukprot:scpid65011/ scgid14233/ 